MGRDLEGRREPCEGHLAKARAQDLAVHVGAAVERRASPGAIDVDAETRSRARGGAQRVTRRGLEVAARSRRVAHRERDV